MQMGDVAILNAQLLSEKFSEFLNVKTSLWYVKPFWKIISYILISVIWYENYLVNCHLKVLNLVAFFRIRSPIPKAEWFDCIFFYLIWTKYSYNILSRHDNSSDV